MVENEITSNLDLEEKKQEKKKLIKNWKLYAVALGIIAIGLGIGLGFGLNVHHSSQTTPINLNNFTKIINGTEAIRDDQTGRIAFQAFIAINKEKYPNLKENDFEYNSFIKPEYKTNGSLVIEPKTNSTKYTGFATITINAIGQININSLGLIINIDGTEAMLNDSLGEKILETFLSTNNQNHSDLNGNIEISSIILPTYNDSGSAIINGINKYTGSITITINNIQNQLGSLIRTTIIRSINDKNEPNKQIINAILGDNSTSNLTSNDLEVISYTAATATSTGSAIVAAKAGNSLNITGQINITILTVGYREQLLQTLRDAYLSKDDYTWILTWQSYFELINETVNSIIYVLTNEQFSNNSLIQEAMFNQFRASILAELNNWNIPEGYQENSITITYSNFAIANGKITTTGTIDLKIYYLNIDEMNYNWSKNFQFTINYVIVN